MPPSASRRATSPERYSRAPSVPHGFGTNRSALSPARPRYPRARPAPPTYSSPTAPRGTGFMSSSSTCSCRSASAPPITLRAPAPISCLCSRRYVTCTVVSVMPYMFTIAGACAPHASIHAPSSDGSSFSPPNTTTRSDSIDASPARRHSRSCCISGTNADGVWFSTVTRSSRSSA
ncbi:hypothetical protein R69619_07880 [Paraburkholderia nemoris]|uniref:Uncharacterized protein n=1 Tax=Paraburkholderia nemoris TaxID=2793076 RepID=A0ABM8T8E4_9BURK|nr:hypothetical protein R69619_07880 [Paraburkholderia nemoris]CAE6862649.1 hypothetical protein R75777_08104 [Paraburkholderia nemoris]CAE6865431.1 hypothetical protein R69776_08227 [Paraburkholderia nemoris]